MFAQTITSADIVTAAVFLLAQGGGIVWGIFKWVMSEIRARDKKLEEEFKERDQQHAVKFASQELTDDIMAKEFSAFREKVAAEYVTARALDSVEQRLSVQVQQVRDDVKQLGNTVIEAVAGRRT